MMRPGTRVKSTAMSNRRRTERSLLEDGAAPNGGARARCPAAPPRHIRARCCEVPFTRALPDTEHQGTEGSTGVHLDGQRRVGKAWVHAACHM